MLFKTDPMNILHLNKFNPKHMFSMTTSNYNLWINVVTEMQ